RRGHQDRGRSCAGRGDYRRDRAQPSGARLRNDRGAAEAPGGYPLCVDPLDRLCRRSVQSLRRAGRAALAPTGILTVSRSALLTPIGAALFALAVLLAWQYCVDHRLVSPIFVASPTGIGSALVRLAASGELWDALGPTLGRMLGGWAVAAALGIALGALV